MTTEKQIDRLAVDCRLHRIKCAAQALLVVSQNTDLDEPVAGALYGLSSDIMDQLALVRTEMSKAIIAKRGLFNG